MKKLFKRIALWAIYYLVSAAFVAFLAFKHADNVVLLSDSWFPAAYALCNLLFAIFLMSKFHARLWIIHYKQHLYIYRNIVDAHFSLEREHQNTKETFRTLHLITLAFTPAFFFFIPFFNTTAKHFCGFLLLVPSFIWAWYSMWESYLDTKKHNEEIKKEREEQERREELGKWK